MINIADILAIPSLLARSGEMDYIKLVFFAIAAVIWIISAIAKAAGKQAKKPQETWTGETWQPGDSEAAPPMDIQPAPPPTGQWESPQTYVPPPAPATRPSPVSTKQAAPAFRGQQAPVSFPAKWLGQTKPAVQPPPMPVAAPPAYAPTQFSPQFVQQAYVPPQYAATPYVAPPVEPRRVVIRSTPVEQPAWGKVVTGYETARAITSAPAQVKQRAGKAASTTQPLDAAAIRRWMTPSVMKQQFILTELFDPPASARRASKSR